MAANVRNNTVKWNSASPVQKFRGPLLSSLLTFLPENADVSYMHEEEYFAPNLKFLWASGLDLWTQSTGGGKIK